jgi:hypothetical protein
MKIWSWILVLIPLAILFSGETRETHEAIAKTRMLPGTGAGGDPDKVMATDAWEQAFIKLQKLDWKQSFYDPGTSDWHKKWSLDGLKARVFNTPRGMEFYAGPVPAEDSSHAVLWTRQIFTGSLKIEYEYTRLDAATKYVNILYIQATGSGRGDFHEDIIKWPDLRRVPAMRMYFDHMNAYHISYAAYGNTNLEAPEDYIRARRYMPESGRGLEGTDLAPDYFRTGLFGPGVRHEITVIKHGNDLYMEIAAPDKKMLCHWKNAGLPPIEKGRIGLRHMASRNARYKNFRVAELTKGGS